MVEGVIPSQPPSTLQSPFDVSHKLLYKVKVSRVSIFGYLAADMLRKCFGHLSWVIQGRNFSLCYPFG